MECQCLFFSLQHFTRSIVIYCNKWNILNKISFLSLGVSPGEGTQSFPTPLESPRRLGVIGTVSLEVLWL